MRQSSSWKPDCQVDSYLTSAHSQCCQGCSYTLDWKEFSKRQANCVVFPMNSSRRRSRTIINTAKHTEDSEM
ncbi:hypothetical protein ElyMa_005370500 [Elysia marginata]|uniref:Uncharacterized protein n=1 Tax=Elysia marginata TaxID=1093978 RepID=A0AAV4ECR6_9GAST|nr:hypothetical protein ElyMa_005370500 [Elysia marginata]